MLLNIMVVTLAVFVGNTLFYGALFALAMNKKFLKWYTKYTMKKSVEIGNELFDEKGVI